MSPSTGDARRVEVHFSTDDQALVLELNEDPGGDDVDGLMEALHAANIDDAERGLLATTTGPTPIGRMDGRHR